MSVFYRDIDVNISDYKSELSKPLVVYERDRGLEIYFNLIRYAYRFDKNPENLLENLVGAYATVTLVNPSGYEISIDEVEITEDAKVKFVITEDLTDELTEIGTYQLQIHVNNDIEGRDTSVFSIPPFEFEVRERLKGKKNELLDSEGNGLTDKEGYQLVSASTNKVINFSADKINEYLSSIPTIQDEIKDINSQLEQKTYYCNTVADMKNKNFKVGDCVNTLGYYVINDGGKSEYIIINKDDITSDNGKYIVLKNGLIASLIDNNVNNVKQFGAKADGITDDTKAFNDYANWGGMLGKHLNIPWGVYFINDEFIIENNTLFGGGFHRTTLKIGENGKITVKGIRNKIENIVLEGNSIDSKSPIGLVIDGASHSIFRDIEIHQFTIGVNINKNSWSNEFQKVIMYHNDICLEAKGTEINNTSFIDCHAVSSRVGFNMISPDDGFHYKINFIGCQFELNDDAGLYIQANGSYTINGCYFERNNTSYRTDYNKGGLVVSYPNTYGPRPACIDIIGCYHIASNIRLKQTNASTTTIISNYFKDIENFGIEVLNSTVSPNKILNINPSYEMVQVDVSHKDNVYTLNPKEMYVESTTRPSSPTTGQLTFDITINKPIWWNGYQWNDANGNIV